MKLVVSEELLAIFKSISKRNLTLTEWREIESDDEFQTANYCGGFDATEDEFCFSFYDINKAQYWFQKSLKEIEEINSGKISEFQIRLAE
ncbi:hypothetical protein [Algibacter sp. L1A34]|uniref:hypothetical protein n=1 Tax=Algibacter sp. L1A34 TaxID=2686365 RepID=UPI00131E8541|nr:hypothetical protein [Algibacter sp. L1A34]